MDLQFDTAISSALQAQIDNLVVDAFAQPNVQMLLSQMLLLVAPVLAPVVDDSSVVLNVENVAPVVAITGAGVIGGEVGVVTITGAGVGTGTGGCVGAGTGGGVLFGIMVEGPIGGRPLAGFFTQYPPLPLPL